VGFVNRRNGYRIPVQMFLNEYVADNPHRCMSGNISPSGLYLNRLIQPVERRSSIVGLEFELPGTSEVIWARGEVRYDTLDPYFHGTGVQITGIAVRHQRLLRDYVLDNRAQQLRKLLALVRRNRMH
jgi:hypothetical protein